MIKLLIGFIVGISLAYWAQPWLNEKEHTKITKTIVGVRDSFYKKCKKIEADLIGANISEAVYECAGGAKLFLRTKSESYWIERAVR